MAEDEYLKPTFFLDSDTPALRKAALDLTAHAVEEEKKSVALFLFVRDAVSYQVFVERSSPEHYRASHVLARKEGYCVQKALLLVTMCRAVGIPARLRFAEIRNHITPQRLLEMRGTDVFAYHGLAEMFINGKWLKATPTHDIRHCGKYGILPVEFNGHEDAMLPAYTRDGRPHIEYLKDRGHYADLPFEELMKASLSRKYMPGGSADEKP